MAIYLTQYKIPYAVKVLSWLIKNVLVQLISEKTPSTASSNKTSIGNTSLNVVVVQEEQRVQENHLQQNHIKVVYYILYHRAI